MDKLLVTGAAGNLGSHIVKRLADEGAAVRALVLPGDGAANRLPQGIETVRGDVTDPEDVARFLGSDPDERITVIHAAGIVTIFNGYSERVYRVNVEGTRNVVNACIARGVKKLVYVSSVHAIAPLPKGEQMREPERFEPEKIRGFYGKTKAEASQIVMNAHGESGLDTSIVFPSGLLGPEDHGIGHTTRLLIECASGRLPAGVNGAYDFADVRDVAAGVIAAARKGGAGQNYILGNRSVSVKELLRAACECASSREVRIFLPLWLIKPAAPLCEAYYRLSGRKPLFTRYSLEVLGSNGSFVSDKARRELGYTTRPIEESVADTVRWLVDEGMVNKGKGIVP